MSAFLYFLEVEPGDRAEVLVRRKALFAESSVESKVLNITDSSFVLIEVVLCELLLSPVSFLDKGESSILNVPFAPGSIDLSDIVVESLVEGEHEGNLFSPNVYFLREDYPVVSKFRHVL